MKCAAEVDAAAGVAEEVLLRQYVLTRTPVVLRGFTAAAEHGFDVDSFSDENLNRVQDVSVWVERRSNDQESFGSNSQVNLKFSEFLKRVLEGESNLYLTAQTQDTLQECNPHAELFEALIRVCSIPNGVAALSRLKLESRNVWMGAGSGTSGFHHDFHDNVYVVLRGTKTFTISPPDSVKKLPMHGDFLSLDKLGRITYSSPKNRKRQQLEERHCQAALKMEQVVRIEDEEERERLLELAEAEMDLIMDEMLELESNQDPETETEKSLYPNSFCMLDSQAAAKIVPTTTFSLNAGDALYLPCGWFHEVFSTPSPAEEMHLAVNYWYHPNKITKLLGKTKRSRKNQHQETRSKLMKRQV